MLRPIINSASSARVAPATLRSATSLPPRKTLTRLQAARISPSLWEMKIMERPLRHEAFEGFKQGGGFLRRENRGGFIKHQNFGFPVQGFENLDPLAFANREGGNNCIRVHLQAEFLRQVP